MPVGAGTTPTGIYVALYATNGTRFAVSANLAAGSMWTGAASWITAGALSSPYTFTAPTAAYLCLLFNGQYGTTSAQTLGATQSGLGARRSGGLYSAVNQASQATMPSSATFSFSSEGYWFGWS